jgi:amino acid transporter
VFAKTSTGSKVRRLLVGKERSPLDRGIFHRLSLVAFFAWVGLGSDGMSSSCYGPEEVFLALKAHPHLSLIVGVLAVLTIFIISASYSQVIERFPTGGGGYLVASKLLSPTVGMFGGCALLIDYVLTIAISIASGSDAIFSFLPPDLLPLKLWVALAGVVGLALLNLRGVRESVVPLTPIFLIFLGTHAVVIAYAVIDHAGNVPKVVAGLGSDVSATYGEIGLLGMMALIMRAFGVGAGTFTGIEAVSNGLASLRDPKVETGKRTMRYMAVSLSVLVFGLITAYLLYGVDHLAGKTLNAVLFETMTQDWGVSGRLFVLVTLFAEAMILFVAAQTGFLGGPKVLSNMAMDRWAPTKFASLSDRLVSQNGILLMATAALVTMAITKGSVKLLVILYSINVFITFCLSQLGMVRHWWAERGSQWKRKLAVSGTGFVVCSFILISVVVIKFFDGGWVTLFITGLLATLAYRIRRNYLKTLKKLSRLNSLMDVARVSIDDMLPDQNPPPFDPNAKTAVIFVNGYNGLGLHSLFNVVRLFGDEFKNYVFVQFGIIDAGNFKGTAEIDNLKRQTEQDVSQYCELMRRQGANTEGIASIGIDVVSELDKVAPTIMAKYPSAVFFGGQLVFDESSLFDRWLHNYTVFAMQQRFHKEGVPYVILPIRVDL